MLAVFSLFLGLHCTLNRSVSLIPPVNSVCRISSLALIILTNLYKFSLRAREHVCLYVGDRHSPVRWCFTGEVPQARATLSMCLGFSQVGGAISRQFMMLGTIWGGTFILIECKTNYPEKKLADLSQTFCASEEHFKYFIVGVLEVNHAKSLYF